MKKTEGNTKWCTFQKKKKYKEWCREKLKKKEKSE